MRYNQIKINEKETDYTMIDGQGVETPPNVAPPIAPTPTVTPTVTDIPDPVKWMTSTMRKRTDQLADIFNVFGPNREVTDYKYTPPGPNVPTFKEIKAWHLDGKENYKAIPDWIKKEEWHDIHGFNFSGTSEEADLLRKGIEDQAKVWNVPPRAFTNNQTNLITSGSGKPQKTSDGFGKDQVTLGSQSPGYTKDMPFMSQIDLGKVTPAYMKHTFPHEWAHHISMNIAAVDEKGGVRHGNKDRRLVQYQSPENYVTGFGIGPNATREYLNILDRSRGQDGIVDAVEARGKLFNQFMASDSNKQRPELKKATALMTSFILSDNHLLYAAQSSKNDWPKQYRFHPEEQFARALAEYSRLQVLPPEERFKGKTKINKDTYDAIQYWSDTKKVINGNTIAKNRTTNNNKLA
jgi:hypothetical protein